MNVPLNFSFTLFVMIGMDEEEIFKERSETGSCSLNSLPYSSPKSLLTVKFNMLTRLIFTTLVCLPAKCVLTVWLIPSETGLFIVL